MLRLKEETAHLYQQTSDIFYLLISIELSCIIQKMHGEVISTDLIQPLKDFLAKTATWGHFETKIFTDNMVFLDIDTTLVFADSLLKNFRQYSNYGIYEQDILLALINLTIRCFDCNYLEEAEYYLTLINRKQKNPKLFYERNMYLFLTGINAVKNKDIPRGEETALCAIQIFEDLDMKKSAEKYQKYLDKHLELMTKQAL
ncbi:hypothetical protein [Listeria cornellensis]|uniref:Positive transcriptional regulator MutR family protein n=1 Tax=Listeria cornellensis FSL F6-0969 TaxID=1265820 RepID=W7BN36_9LIST|nr:hypothetical protein [Listeria cornellensis]EUJ26330.1 positive transcriptional regulator MutR family protein [Listeria cornellensis FSL F6-0969]